MRKSVYEEAYSSDELFEDNIFVAENIEFHDVVENKKITKEKIKQQIDKFTIKAKKLVENKDKLSAVLKKAIALCEKLSKLPMVGKQIKEFSYAIEMIDDYIQGVYTQVPKSTIITLVAAVLYFLAPIDLIPDAIPLIGYADDILVFKTIKDALRRDIKKYRAWKEEQNEADVIDI